MPIYLPNVVTDKINSWLFMNILHSSRFAVKNGQTHGQAHLCILNNASIINSTSSVCSMISKIFKDFKIMVILMSANVSGNPWLSHRYCPTDASKLTKPMGRLNPEKFQSLHFQALKIFISLYKLDLSRTRILVKFTICF